MNNPIFKNFTMKHFSTDKIFAVTRMGTFNSPAYQTTSMWANCLEPWVSVLYWHFGNGWLVQKTIICMESINQWVSFAYPNSLPMATTKADDWWLFAGFSLFVFPMIFTLLHTPPWSQDHIDCKTEQVSFAFCFSLVGRAKLPPKLSHQTLHWFPSDQSCQVYFSQMLTSLLMIILHTLLALHHYPRTY